MARGDKVGGVSTRLQGSASAASLRNLAYAALTESSHAGSEEQALRRQVMGLLQQISQQLDVASATTARAVGLHSTDLTVLSLLHLLGKGEPLRAIQIQHALGFTPGGMTRRLDTMQAQGLVERIADPLDRRAWLVAATELGIEKAKAAQAMTEIRNRRLYMEFSLDDWHLLVPMLERLSKTLAGESESSLGCPKGGK